MLACELKIAVFRVGARVMGQSLLVLAFLGPLVGTGLVPADAPPGASVQGERWTAVRLAGDLRAKDTEKIDKLTAGEEQKSSFEQCLAADEADLCRVLVGAVHVASLVVSVVTSQ